MENYVATEQAYKNGFKDGKLAGENSNDKRLSRLSTINRALGMIEGVACGVNLDVADTLLAAVEMLDVAVKELMEGG